MDHAERSPRRADDARSAITKWRMRGVAAFAVIMAAGCVVGLLFFARPATSETERRNLTVFPAFTDEGFLNGEYFTQVSLWYADTYPLREPKDLDSFKYADGGEFTGTYYDSISELMTPHVDEFETYAPKDANEIACWGTVGDEWKDDIVEDTSGWGSTMGKYDALSGSTSVTPAFSPPASRVAGNYQKTNI